MHRRFMTATEQPEKVAEKVSLPTLTAMVVGSMIGSGVFLLPRRCGTETGVLGAIIAWIIAGTGMLMLAFVLISLLLVALLFAADALDFMLDLTAALSLIPYLLAAAYAVKLTVTRETYGEGKSLVPDMTVAAVATVYTLFLIHAAGVDKLLLSCILYAPAAALYFKARRESGLRVFRPAEAVLFGVIVLGAVAGVVSLATGAIEI